MILLLIVVKFIYGLNKLYFILFGVCSSLNYKDYEMFFNGDVKLGKNEIYGVNHLLKDLKKIFKCTPFSLVPIIKFTVTYILFISGVLACVVFYFISKVYTIKNTKILFYFLLPAENFVDNSKKTFSNFTVTENSFKVMLNRFCIVKSIGISVVFLNGARALNKFLGSTASGYECFKQTEKYVSGRKKKESIEVIAGEKYKTPVQKIYDITLINHENKIETRAFGWEEINADYCVKEKIKIVNQELNMNIKITSVSREKRIKNIIFRRRLTTYYHLINNTNDCLSKNIILYKGAKGETGDCGNLTFYFSRTEVLFFKNTKFIDKGNNVGNFGGVDIAIQENEVTIFFDQKSSFIAA